MPKATRTANSATLLDFNRDIRPILAENCFACHGPDKNKRKAGLRLDRQLEATGLLESGGKAIVPKDPDHSLLIKVITTQNEDDRMPPRKTGKRLTAEQVQKLRDWISQGAAFKEHWSYLPPERPALPEVTLKKWPRNEIDYFILARLEKEGLRPSSEADKTTLIRRVTLDLTGLPPTLKEVDAFLKDSSAEAYERVVDRLLASPAFGERMAQQWLDLARYADSDGYHADAPRSMWQYRDYVIQSFNQNKPFDQFTVEQLAGDLLPSPTQDQRIATAFNRNGMSSTEGGADPDEYMNKYVTDRVNTFGTVFLGSSTACTECHDHKYDPFTQKEYYQLYDFFNRIPEKGLDSDPAPPFIKLPKAGQAESLSQLNQQVASLEKRRREELDRSDEGLKKSQEAWEQKVGNRIQAGWEPLHAIQVKSQNGVQLTRLPDDSILATASGQIPSQDTYEAVFETDRNLATGLQIEVLPDQSLPSGGWSLSSHGDFSLTGLEVEVESRNPQKEESASQWEWSAWKTLGPFQASSVKECFEKAFIDEAQANPESTPAPDPLHWSTPKDWKEGSTIALSGEHQVTYFYRTVRVPTARYATVRFGSDGGQQLWVNGKKFRDGKIFKKVAPAPEEERIFLQAGTNTLLFKVRHGEGLYGFLFSPASEPVTRYRVDFETGISDPGSPESGIQKVLDDKPDTGWKVPAFQPQERDRAVAMLYPRTPVAFLGGTRWKVRMHFRSADPQSILGHFRIACTDQASKEDSVGLPQLLVSAFLNAHATQKAETQTSLREYYREHFVESCKSVNASLAEARKAAKDLDNSIPTIRVMQDMPEGRVTQVRVRGDYRNKGDVVAAGVPHVLPPLPSSNQTNRLTLARWLTDPKHPLLGRVSVNRYWALLFGTGLVKTGNEFGTQGELPSHPDLLDWLARDWIDGGWNLKATLKRMVLSATYRQSSKATPELLAKDPNNRLLARGPRFRLTAETIRDCALDYAGLLDRTRAPGGPSVKPYQPAGLWEEKMFGGNTYEESKGQDLYRRSLYTLWKRTVLNPTLMTFDAPDRAICTEQRSVTCTPLQALVTLNEKGFIEAARVFAGRILKEGGQDLPHQLEFAFRTVLARRPTAKEEKLLTSIHDELITTYSKDLKSAMDLLTVGEAKRIDTVNELELAAWTGVANVLMNLDETLTKE